MNTGESTLLRAEALRLPGLGTHPISLALRAGDRWGLFGPAGSGKAALLRVLARLDKPDAGRLVWGDMDVSRRPTWVPGFPRDYVVMIWGNPYLIFDDRGRVRTILEDRGSGESLAGTLVAYGLSPAVLDYEVGALSGLERLRLALVFAYQHRPRVMLVDDVFDHLAPETWDEATAMMAQVVGQRGALVIASRHPAALARTTEVRVIQAGDVVEQGPSAQVLQTTRRLTA